MSRLPRWNVQAPTERDRQVCEIAANSDLLSKSVERSSIGTSLPAIEFEVLMNKTANRLNAFPSGSCCRKCSPSEIQHPISGDVNLPGLTRRPLY
jgi:hypothetical protein